MRKYVVYFGTLFNDIQVQRKNSNSEVEQVLKVPLMYGPKAKFLARLRGDPELTRSTAITLPRISFEVTSFAYDGTRKLQTTNKIVQKDADGVATVQYVPVPYDLYFQMTIYSKNADDMLQIVEQIIPHFKPDYTATLNLLPNVEWKVDVPIELQSVLVEDTYEGSFEQPRILQYTLLFNMKAVFFGPTRQGGLIKKAIVNLSTSVKGRRSELNINSNIGSFDILEVVQQNLPNGNTAFGILYKANSTVLTLHSVQGNFVANTPIIGQSSNAIATVISTKEQSTVNERITVRPALTANGQPTTNTAISVDLDLIGPEDNYGIAINIEEL